MRFFTVLNYLLIKPLELLFETIFTIVFEVSQNSGIAIIFLSLFINLLLLPLYKKADAIQKETMEEEKRLRPWVEHIKANFFGDERYMILQTYYRQNKYKPTNALRGSVSLLLEIPFFIAAYQFLSNLLLFDGAAMGLIGDLGKPDGIIFIAGKHINILPILMTVINIYSSYIYTSEYPLKNKLQLYAMAVIFMILLYQSPSALVLYWTLNNLFSLIKNIVSRKKNSERIVAAAGLFAGIFLTINVLMFKPYALLRYKVIFLLFLVPLYLPMMRLLSAEYGFRKNKVFYADIQNKEVFFADCAFLAVLTGLLIPSAVVENAPDEFAQAAILKNPGGYILYAFCIAVGAFFVWAGIFYFLSSSKRKHITAFVTSIFSGAALVNYLFFGKTFGNLSSQMKFDFPPIATVEEQILNLLILLLVIAVVSFLWFRHKKMLRNVILLSTVAIIIMSGLNTYRAYKKGKDAVKEIKVSREEMPVIPLSRHGKNVVIFMLDRAVGINIPYIFNERPELKEQFKGFTYYPYTLSHGLNTNLGAPGLFGGYEYTPDQMNRRTDQTLAEKHDEALLVLPKLFSDNDYEVTVVDPPLAGYAVRSAEEVYREYPEINAFWLMDQFRYISEEKAEKLQKRVIRNLFYYGLFKISPLVIQPVLYADGTYNITDEFEAEHHSVKAEDLFEQITDGPSKATGLNHNFIKSYKALKVLPDITEVREDNRNTFLAIANNITHSPMILKVPDYEPESFVDNTIYDNEHKDRFYYDDYEMDVSTSEKMANHHCNVSGIILLGQWLEYLRENNVYDNTRIIVVSDHGYLIKYFKNLVFLDEWPGDMLAFNALMMVKDFDCQADFSMDPTFMTNADVPTLVTEDLIVNPMNPFTGNPINNLTKEKDEQIISMSGEWEFYNNNTSKYLPSSWYKVSKNIFNKKHWRKIAEQTNMPVD